MNCVQANSTFSTISTIWRKSAVLNVTSTLCRYWKSRWISPATTLITLTAAKRPAENEAELNALWDSKVKFDELSLKLTGKTDKEIRETLTRRYKFAIRRLAQTNSEDVFSLAMTAFAREIDPHTNYLSRVIPNSSTLK